MGTRRFEETVKLDNGLIIPASAAAGKYLESENSEGKARWASLVGAWTNWTYGTKWEASGSGNTPQARSEYGSVVRLRGIVKVKTGQTVANEETVLTLPVGLRPPALTDITTQTTAASPRWLQITTEGVVKLRNSSMLAEELLLLDGLTYSL